MDDESEPIEFLPWYFVLGFLLAAVGGLLLDALVRYVRGDL